MLTSAAALAAICSLSPAGESIELSVIATGAQAGGDMPPGGFDRFVNFTNPNIDAQGRLTFTSLMFPSSASTIWTWSDGEFARLATWREEAPGSGGEQFNTLSPPGIDLGKVCFHGTLQVSNFANPEGIWIGEPGSTELLIREGDAIPGGDFTYETFRPPTILSSGELTFVAEFDDGEEGVFMGPPDALRGVALEGTRPPGFSSSRRIQGVDTFASEPDGGVAFELRVSGFDRGIFHAASGATGATLVARTDGVAPDTGGRIFNGSFSTPSVGADGSVAFTANTNTGGTDGIWIWKDGEMDRVLGGYTEPPGIPGERFERLLFNTVDNAPVCDGVGRIAVLLHVGSDSNREGIWFGGLGGLDLIALEQETAPGRGRTWDRISKPFVSPAGHVVFLSRTDDEGWARHGIWATDVDGQLHTLVETWEEIDIRGQTQTISGVALASSTSSDAHRTRPVNARGEVLFTLTTFEGTTALMRATIPLPADATQTSVVEIASGYALRIRSLPAHHYQLERSTDGERWDEAGEPVEGTGDLLHFPIDMGDPTALFRLAISAG